MNRTTAANDSAQALLRVLQEKVLLATSLIYAVASVAVTMAVLVRSSQTLGGIRPVTWVALLVPTVCCGVYILRHRLPYRTRATALIGITVLASLIGTNRLGLMGAGLWALLLVVPALSLMYFGSRTAVLVLATNFLLSSVIAARWISGAHPLDYDAVAFTVSATSWITTILMAVTLSIILLVALRYLYMAFLESTRQLRMTENQARLSEERLTTLISNMPGIAFRGLTDPQRSMVFVSQACRELTGFAPPVPGSGEPLLWCPLILEEDRAGVMQTLANIRSSGDVYQASYRIRTSDERVLWVSEQGRLLVDPLGLRSVEGIITDQSAQKTLEGLLQREAHTDALTGLPNRRKFEEQLQQEWLRVQRYRTPCALLMLDVDNFKRVNDQWGHAVGDTVLKTLGEQCVLLLRETDCIGRLGGEEFAILLPQSDLARAHDTAERVREALAAIVLPVGDKDVLQFTVSIGCTALDISDKNSAQTMARADSAMYRAKSLGRNRVESAPVPSLPRAAH